MALQLLKSILPCPSTIPCVLMKMGGQLGHFARPSRPPTPWQPPPCHWPSKRPRLRHSLFPGRVVVRGWTVVLVKSRVLIFPGRSVSRALPSPPSPYVHRAPLHMVSLCKVRSWLSRTCVCLVFVFVFWLVGWWVGGYCTPTRSLGACIHVVVDDTHSCLVVL